MDGAILEQLKKAKVACFRAIELEGWVGLCKDYLGKIMLLSFGKENFLIARRRRSWSRKGRGLRVKS